MLAKNIELLVRNFHFPETVSNKSLATTNLQLIIVAIGATVIIIFSNFNKIRSTF